MSIRIYYGIPRAGKSWEGATTDIYQALLDGRKVHAYLEGITHEGYSRVTGLSLEKVQEQLDIINSLDEISYEYSLATKKRIDSSDEDEDAEEDEGDDNDEIQPPSARAKRLAEIDGDTYRMIRGDIFPTSSFDYSRRFKPGSLIVLDEPWNVYEGNSIPRAVKSFHKMHGHFVDEKTGYTCDILYLTQDPVGDLPRVIVKMCESKYEFTNLEAVSGIKGQYQYVIRYGNSKVITRHVKVRDYKKFGGLYKSHQANSKVTEKKDKNMSMFNSFIIKRVLPFMFILLAFLFWKFGGKVLETFGGKKADSAESAASASASASSPTVAPTPVFKSAQTSTWRVIFKYSVNGMPVFVIEDDKGHTRTVSAPPYSRGFSEDIAIQVDGETVTPYSNSTPTYQSSSNSGNFSGLPSVTH